MLCSLIALPVWAQPASSNSLENSTLIISPQAMTMLEEGSASIGIAGTGKLAISCSTSAYFTIDEIGVEASLQRWNGSKWINVQTFPFANYDASYINKNFLTQ